MTRALLNLRRRSLLRGTLLVLLSLAASIPLSDFPNSRPNPFLILPAILALGGTLETVRCMQKRWNLYHGGVVFCIYMDLMAICMIVFLLVYPYCV